MYDIPMTDLLTTMAGLESLNSEKRTIASRKCAAICQQYVDIIERDKSTLQRDFGNADAVEREADAIRDGAANDDQAAKAEFHTRVLSQGLRRLERQLNFIRAARDLLNGDPTQN